MSGGMHYPGHEAFMYPGHAALAALRRGEVLDIQGLRFRMALGSDGRETPVAPGDMYIGARNTVDVYVARFIHDGCVYPEGLGYPFNIGECVKVIEVGQGEGPVVFALAKD